MKKARVDAHVGLLIKFLNNSITNEINRKDVYKRQELL